MNPDTKVLCKLTHGNDELGWMWFDTAYNQPVWINNKLVFNTKAEAQEAFDQIWKSV